MSCATLCRVSRNVRAQKYATEFQVNFYNKFSRRSPGNTGIIEVSYVYKIKFSKVEMNFEVNPEVKWDINELK
jgi:hypothetical protein